MPYHGGQTTFRDFRKIYFRGFYTLVIGSLKLSRKKAINAQNSSFYHHKRKETVKEQYNHKRCVQLDKRFKRTATNPLTPISLRESGQLGLLNQDALLEHRGRFSWNLKQPLITWSCQITRQTKNIPLLPKWLTTKLARVVTTNEELPFSHLNFQSRGLGRTSDKLNMLYLHFHWINGHHIW